MKNIRRELSIFTLIIIFLLTSVSQSFASDLEDNEEIQELGNVITFLLRHDLVFVENPLLEDYINNIIKRISTANDLPQQYHVKIVNDFVPNSFSNLNGPLYITTGLLDRINNEDELALILSHELAHINNQDMFNLFLDIKGKRTAMITGGVILASLLMVATVGMAAAAAGPMGTATTSSTLISSAGAAGATTALGATIGPPKIEGVDSIKQFSKTRFGKVGIFTEGEHHPVYAPSLFGALMQGVYMGYEQEKEIEANKLALEYYSKTGFKADVGKELVTRFSGENADISQSHFEVFINTLIPEKNED